MATLEQPDVFLGYQTELMEAVSRYPVTVVEKSRRTGYSWAAAAVAVLMASALKSAGGMNFFYMGYNQEMTREFVGYVGEWAKQLALVTREIGEEIFTDPERPEKEILAFRVGFASGFSVRALSSAPRSLRGMQGFVMIDEAAFHDDLDAVLKAATALLIWGGKVLVISTHNGDANPFNVLIQRVRAGRLPYHPLRCTLDDAIADGLAERTLYVQGKPPIAREAWRAEVVAMQGDNADEELFCIPSAGSGAYLSLALIEARMRPDIPVIRYTPGPGFLFLAEHLREAAIREFCERELLPVLKTLDPGTPHVYGLDFGRKRDLTVLLPLAMRRDMVNATPFVLELRNVPYEAQRQILFYIVDRLPKFRAGKHDATGNGGFLAEAAQQRYGERIEAVMLNEPWYRDNMPRWKAAFEDGLITIPQDREIADDHRLVKLIRGVGRIPEERTGEADKKRHGDSAVASALAIAATRAEPEVYGYEGVPRMLARPVGGGDPFFNTADAANDAQDEREREGIMPAMTRRAY